MITEEFWQEKRVFITGHTGFKGSWLSLWLKELGAKLYGYSLMPPTTPNLFEGAHVKDCFEKSYIADINDYKVLMSAMQESNPEIVIHMAAQPLVRDSYDNPIYTYQTNVMGTVNFLESIKNCNNVKAALVITTDKCYENNEWYWGYREIDRLGGFDPYSSSKACAELVTAAYRQSFLSDKVALATARAGNVIGGGDWAKDRLIPDCLKAISQNKIIEIRNFNAIRPWQHVLEALHGYLMLLEKLYYNRNGFAESWNFGPNEEAAVNVGTIVDMLCEKLHGRYKVQQAKTNCHEAKYLKLDCSKAYNELGWRPVMEFRQTIELIIDWYKVYTNEENMRKITLEQIKQYMKKIKHN